MIIFQMATSSASHYPKSQQKFAILCYYPSPTAQKVMSIFLEKDTTKAKFSLMLRLPGLEVAFTLSVQKVTARLAAAAAATTKK